MASRRAETRTGGRPASTGVISGDFALSVGRPDKPAPRDWQWTPLSDVARLETGHTPSKKHPEYWGGDVPWIGIKDATENHGRVITDTYQHTNELGIANSSARILPENTVCLSRTASVGYVIVMGKPMATSQDFVNWVCSDALDHSFLKYVLLAERSAFLRFASGTTHQTIYFPEVKAFQVCLPPISEQRAIADILGTLDDKIELNRRMSETLEAMARALFKSWFVDFDPVRAKAEGREPGLPKPLADLFPARLVDSELGEIPEGWEVAAVGDLADVEKGLSYKGAGLSDERGLPMINLGCFAGQGQFRSEKIKRYQGEHRDRHLVRSGDLLIANTDMTQNRVVLGSPAFVPASEEDHVYLFTHHTFAFRFHPGAERWRQYVYFALLRPEFREVAEGFATGTTVLALPRDGVLTYSLALPAEPLRAAFDEHVGTLFASSETRRQQSKTLAALRDILLPKLISGELRVPEVERIVSRAET